MISKISITTPQRFPSNWQLNLDDIPIPSERDLRYRDWMGEEFWSQISLGINTRALTFALMHAFDRISSPPPTLEARMEGAFNEVYTATFPPTSSSHEEELTVVIRMPYQTSRIPGRVETTAALMTFAREHLGMPVPKVFAWNDSNEQDTNANPVNSPYIIMEYAPGARPIPIWTKTPDQDHWYKMLDAFAKGHATLGKPLPWKGYGSVYFAQDDPQDLTKLEAYRLGPFIPGPMATTDRRSVGPYRVTGKSLVEFWTMLWETEVDSVKRRHGSNLSTPLRFDDDEEEEDIDNRKDDEAIQTLADFLATANDLLEFIRPCPLPTNPTLYEPCIVPMDYAFRNARIDPVSFEIKAYLDWDDYAILPFILCSRFVDEIRDEPGVTKEWFEEEGGFRFLPPEEKEKYEGEVRDILEELVEDLLEQRCREGGQRQTVEAGWPKQDKANKGEGNSSEEGAKAENGLREEEEEEKEEEKEEERDEPPASIAEIHPPEGDGMEVYRRWRLFNTHFQREYMKLLERYDERFAIPGFWKAREDALKIHHLMTFGWTEWMSKSDWIKRRMKCVTGLGNRN